MGEEGQLDNPISLYLKIVEYRFVSFNRSILGGEMQENIYITDFILDA